MKFNADSFFSTLDWVVFFLALGITFAAIIWGQLRKKANSGDGFIDHLLMGRRLTLPLFVATLVATWYGGIFGVTEIAFNKGLFNFLTQGIFWYVTYLLFAFFLAKKVRSTEAITLPDLVGKTFGPKSAKLSAILNFFNVLPISYIISVGIFVQFFSGFSLPISMLLGTSIVVLYSLYGGFRAVVFSDLVQFFLMCFGVFLVFALSIYEYGGISYLIANLPAAHLSLSGGESFWTIMVWGFIALSTLVDPNFYHRCFAAESHQTAKKGIIVSTFIWFCFDICTTFGALYAKASSQYSDSSQAYLNYGLDILPHGFKGLFTAGILATIFSTLDSYLFLAGTTISFDLLPSKNKFSKYAHHLSILFTAAFAYILALSFEGDIKSVWKTLGSLSAGALLLPVVFAQLKVIKITDIQFVATCLSSAIAMTAWRTGISGILNSSIDELYIGVIVSSLFLIFFTIQNKAKTV